MYSEEDLNAAVSAGALSAEAAAGLRAHVAKTREMPRSDEENFRLVTSFNDIFVTIAAILLLAAAGGIGQSFTPRLSGPPPLSGLLIAGAAWGMAEFFTRKRRMALPSIVLLLAFVGAVFYALLGVVFLVLGETRLEDNPVGSGLLIALAALLTAGAAYVHWRRFMVPITVAAGAGALAVMVIALIATAIGPRMFDDGIIIPLIFALGLAIFAVAMRWDISDRERTTRRSDVAFWLHLLAAPMIAHPLFHWLRVTGGDNIGPAAALGVLAVYVAIGMVALAIDRRAMLVSALAYVLAALTFLFDRFGAVELNVALTALVIGSALLTLSAFWSPIRSRIVTQLPAGWQARLPLAQGAAA